MVNSIDPLIRGLSAWELMKKEDPSETNLFRFISKRGRTFTQNTTQPDLLLQPFRCLQSSLYACGLNRSPEKQLDAFKESLFLMDQHIPAIAQPLGLSHKNIVEKIVHDARSFLTAPKEISFSADIDEETKKTFALAIEALVTETLLFNIGETNYLFASDASPWKTFECKKTAESSYLISIVKADHPLSEQDKKSLTQALKEALLSDNNVAKILYGLEHGWKGFAKPRPAHPDLSLQAHGIPKLKVYKDYKNRIVADVALYELGGGATKCAKREIKILPDGATQNLARYTKNTLGPDKKLAQISFFYDISREIAVRKKMGPIPNLLDLYEAGTYLNKRGISKKRYEAPICAGTLSSLIQDETTLPPQRSQREILQALRCAADALQALEAMHAKGFVHKDVKLDNIFYITDDHNVPIQGILADLAFTAHKTEKYNNCGSPITLPPESFLLNASNDPSRDMFAFGAILLAIYRTDFRAEFYRLQGGISRCKGDKALTYSEYITGLQKLRETLGKTSAATPLDHLIADLLNPIPRDRPDSIQTLERLQKFLGDTLSEPDLKKQKIS